LIAPFGCSAWPLCSCSAAFYPSCLLFFFFPSCRWVCDGCPTGMPRRSFCGRPCILFMSHILPPFDLIIDWKCFPFFVFLAFGLFWNFLLWELPFVTMFLPPCASSWPVRTDFLFPVYWVFFSVSFPSYLLFQSPADHYRVFSSRVFAPRDPSNPPPLIFFCRRTVRHPSRPPFPFSHVLPLF